MSETVSQLDLGHPRVDSICAELELSEETTQAALEQARRVDLEAPINKSGKVVAASSVYFQCLMHNEKRTQGQVCEAAGISELPLRKCYRDIADYEGVPIREYNQEQDRVEAQHPDGTVSRLLEWFR